MTLQPRSLVRILIYRTWTIQNELKLLLAPYKQIFLNSLGNFSNNDGDGYENVTWKWIRATSDFIELRKWNYFHVVVVQRRLRNVQKSVMHVQSCFFANLNLVLFCRSRCRRRRRCLSSLLSLPSGAFLRWCYTRPFATTIFSATQCCNVGTMLQPFEAMSQQCCNAVLL